MTARGLLPLRSPVQVGTPILAGLWDTPSSNWAIPQAGLVIGLPPTPWAGPVAVLPLYC